MNELFENRPAPWGVDKHQFGAASVIDANGATVLTVNGVALAEFIADAANAFATDEDVFTAHDNNMQKIIVLTIQRDEARGEIAELLAIADAQSFQLTAAQARIAELESLPIKCRKRIGSAITDEVIDALQWAACASKDATTETHVSVLMNYLNIVGMVYAGLMYVLEPLAGDEPAKE